LRKRGFQQLATMTQSSDQYLPGILNGIVGMGVVLVSFLVDLRLPIAREPARLMGIALVVAGMALAVWAAAHLQSALLGEVEARRDELIQAEPYRFVRHPLYLGMTIALAGLALALRSVPGLIGALALFLPSEIYRAQLEEKALRRKFGEPWERYAAQTGFILPFIGKR
jgi:protein-S-isoprenylcysteine O-methyltransferase Ste14